MMGQYPGVFFFSFFFLEKQHFCSFGGRLKTETGEKKGINWRVIKILGRFNIYLMKP